MDFVLLEKFLEEKGEKSFRFKQCCEAYASLEKNSWNDVTNLSKNLRNDLVQEIPFWNFSDFEIKESEDKSAKALLKLFDGSLIETVILPAEKNNYTVCLSSQVGCAMGCQFCATGKMGFQRNLTVGEFVDQFFFWKKYLKQNRPNEKLAGAVIMGMGEPMQNYENVSGGLSFIIQNSQINPKHFAISTAGIKEGIIKMQNDEKLNGVNLAISLHAPNQKLRSKLMPLASKNCEINELIDLLKNFSKTKERKVFIEYLMLKNINDSEEQAKELIALLENPKLFHINLIRYNSSDTDFEVSSESQIKKFQNILRDKSFDATRRISYGRDIDGACGQLATNRLK